MIKFEAAIEPVPLSRPRVNTKTRQVYYPPRSMNFKQALGIVGRAAMRGREPLTSKIKMTIDLYKNCKVDCRRYGDVDNHQKAIFDALNEICFADDCQIVDVHCRKYKDKNQRIVIQIWEVKNMTESQKKIFEMADLLKDIAMQDEKALVFEPVYSNFFAILEQLKN